MLKNSRTAKSIEKKPISVVEPKSDLLSRRSFLKGTVGLTAAALATGGLILPAQAQFGGGFREYIPYDATRDIHYGTRYGVIEHHYPEMNPTGEKFTIRPSEVSGWRLVYKYCQLLSLALGSQIHRGAC